MTSLRIAILLGLLSVQTIAFAEAPRFELPIACTPGEDCWPVRYVDQDPGPGTKDYRCGDQTGDGHKGTDIAIPDLAAMAEGVEVLAAAAGTVIGVRDGEPDQDVGTRGGPEALAGRDCGNGVRLDHGGGWTSQVCHLRRGSVRVTTGDTVPVGAPLGLVGLSGVTSFPHLHFGVQRDGVDVDPFVGVARDEGCGRGSAPLWAPDLLEALAYEPVVLAAAGFAGSVPDPEDLRRGWHRERELPRSVPALLFWIDGFWFKAGDRLSFEIIGPQGVVVEDRRVLDEGHRRWFGFAGRKRPEGLWPAGRYSGEFRLERDAEGGRTIEAKVRRVIVLR